MDGITALREYRKAHGLTRAELAERLKVDPTTVFRWEKGHRLPRRSDWSRISKATGIPIYLLAGINQAAE